MEIRIVNLFPVAFLSKKITRKEKKIEKRILFWEYRIKAGVELNNLNLFYFTAGHLTLIFSHGTHISLRMLKKL